MRRFLLLLTILCSAFLTTVQAQTARLTAPKNVCLNSYATMHAYFEDNVNEVMVNWRITYPDGTVLNHRYDQQGNYTGGHHPDFRYMSPTNGQSVTFEAKQIGTYTVRITIDYYNSSNNLRTSSSRTKTFTVYDCSIDECEGTFTPATNFKETFGTFTAGAPRREVQAPATITYAFNGTGALSDNDYSIYYNSRLGGRNEWDDVGDHTDNGYGGMLIANSSDDPKLFYRRQVDGLCPGAKYNFTAWFINLNSLTVLNSTCQSEDYRYAGVTFIVRNATTNAIIKQFNTYDVSMDLSRNLPGDQRLTGWQRFGGTVTLAPGQENVIVEIVNNNPGGCGNDIAVDDIEFVFCAPKIYSYIDGLGVDNDMVCPGAELNLTSVIEPSNYFANPVYRWEYNKNGAGWVTLTETGYTGNNTPILHIGPGVLKEEDYIQYRLMVFEAGNVNSRSCYTPSNMVILSVPRLPSIQASKPRICNGEVTTLTASPLEASGITGYETFQFTGPNIMTWPTMPVPKDKVMVNPTTTSTYQVTGSISYGSYGNGQPRVCTKQASIQIQVDQPPTVNLGPDQTVCVNTPITLDAGAANTAYSILWTPGGATTQTINITSPATAATQAYRAKVTNGECIVEDTVNITSVAYPVPAITGSNVLCDPATFPITATAPATGYTGQWSFVGNNYGATIANANSNSTTLQNMPYDQPVRLRWTVTANGTSCSAYVERDYTKESKPVATVGGNMTQCSRAFTLSGNAPPNATMQGTWTFTAIGGSVVTFADIHDPNTVATLTSGTSATVRWTMAKITPGAVCSAVPATHTITYSAPPTITVTSTNIAACMSGATPQFSVPYTQSGAAKYDLLAVGPNPMPGFVDVLNANFSTSPMKFDIPAGTAAGTYDFRIVARKTSPITCEEIALFTVRIETPSTTPTAGATATAVCLGESTTLTATGTLGSNSQWVWYKGGCGIGTSIGSGATLNITPTATATYYVRAEGGICSNTACGSVTVTVSQPPTPANAGADQEKCNTTIFALSGNTPAVGTGTWTLPAGVTLASGTLTSPTASVNVPAGQTVKLTWTINNGACLGTPDTVVLTNLNPVANNTISADQLVCPGATPNTLNGTTPTGGNGTYTYQWQVSTTSASSGFSNVPGATNDSYTPAVPAQTTWYKRIVTSGACVLASNVIVINISNNAPTVTSTPAAKTVECQTGTDYTLQFGTPVFSHPDGLALTITYNDVTTPQTCGMTITRTWTATDPCGKTASASQTITVEDHTKPVFTTAAPANVTVQCDAVPTQPDLTATDNCTTSVTVVKAQTRTNGACPNSYTLTRTWTATDACGNQTVATQVITVVDNTAPVFTTAAPANVTVQCDAVPTQPDLTATDNCTANVTVVKAQTRTNGACPNSYTLTRTWTATDECGNQTVATQVITVVDNRAPVFTTAAPANVTVQCDAVPAQPNLAATDNCTTNVTVVKAETRTNGACANSYTLTRTWTATDECGNQTVATQVITVVDNTAPVFTATAPADTTVNCDAVPTAPTLTATDNCSAPANVTVNMTQVRTNGACANAYTLVRTWTATDQCGNVATLSQTIHVQDTTKPVFAIAIPADTTVNCDAIPAAPTIAATDNCSSTANVTVNMVQTRTNGSCDNNYTLVRTWTATDECGNVRTAAQTIHVQDTTKPVFAIAIPADTTVNCDAIPAAPSITATDNCSPMANVTVNMVQTRTNGSCDNNYTLVRTWTATDQCGNVRTAAQTIHVQDTTRPVFAIAIPADTTVNCDAIPAAPSITATDNCSPAANVTVNMVEARTNGACANAYTLTRTWTATDECGNVRTAMQTIHVQDTTKPVFAIAIPADTTVNCDAIPTAPSITAIDNCSPAANVTVNMVEARTNGACANAYTLTRTWTATDECGNVRTAMQTIHVKDTTKPVFAIAIPADTTVNCDAIPAAPSITATDNCSPAANVTVNMVEARTNGTCANAYTLTRTWTATDECGNVRTAMQTIHVQDTTKPVFNMPVPADTTVNCDAVPTAATLTANDNCSPAANVTVNMTQTRTNGTCANDYTLVRTWTATDQCGNIATVSQTIHVQDTTKPVFAIAIPADTTVNCDAVPTAPSITATDNCSPAANVTVNMAEARTNGACANAYTLTRTWTATDECGNIRTAMQTIHVQDTTKPVFAIAIPADTTVNCDAVPVQPTLTATDNCSAAANVTVTMNETRVNGTCANAYTLTRTWTATDECGNAFTATQVIHVQDTTRPVFSIAIPADTTVNCDAIPTVTVITATDNCSPAANVTVNMVETRTNGSCANNYTLTRTWTATDECGNINTARQVITVQDTTRPTFNLPIPADTTVNCNAVPAAATLTATDNCSATANVTVTSNEVRTNGACANNYTLTRTWTATDECGNINTATQVITVQDTTRPSFTLPIPADTTVNCDAVPTAATLTATDNCSTTPNVAISMNEVRTNGTCANSYTLTRTWTATDECGNTATVSQVITVQDTTRPTFTLPIPADTTVNCDAVPTAATLTATDNCSTTPNVAISMNEVRTNGTCANSYTLTRTWTATDECGNIATVRQVITVQDTTKPLFNLPVPGDTTVNCDAVPVQPTLTATDNCSATPNVTVTMNETRTNGTCANDYTLTRTWTATDECGNATTLTQVVHVQDTTKPVFAIAIPADTTVNCDAVPVQPTLTATDNCSTTPNVTVTSNEVRTNGTCANSYTLTRTWTATDECGNAITATQVIHVQDTTRPAFSMAIPADTTVNCDAIPTAATITATDNCSTTPNVTVNMVETRTNGSCANSYTLTRIWTATDECGNINTARQVITVQDTTRPTFNLPIPADTTVNCNAIPTAATLTATDNCSTTANVTVTSSEVRTNGTCTNSYTLTRTWTATDECGNINTATQVITVQDTTRPTFTLPIPADTTVNCDAVPTAATLTATDNCSATPNVAISMNEVRTNGTCANSYTLTRTWTATDECGNIATVSQVITVQDTTRPTFTLPIPADTTVNCDAVPSAATLTATDNCSTTPNVAVSMNEIRTNGSCANNYTITRTWTATDECGNIATVSQVITVQDTTKPVFNLPVPADTTVNCDAVPAQPTLTATDNCSTTPNVTVTMNETRTSGTCVNDYTLTRTWTATDECGNATTLTQIVHVQDTTRPAFNLPIPADTTVNCDAVPTAATLTATDNCSATPNVTVIMNEVRTNGACVNNYTLTRTWTATDECGNINTARQVITVQDTTRPTFNLPIPADTTVNCDAIPTAATITATDNCSTTPNVTVNMVETRTNGSCANSYTLTRTWTATDECGNINSARQVITVQDTTRPTFNLPIPADTTVNCNAIPTTATLTATDNCSTTANVTVTSSEVRTNGTCANSYTLTRTWTATDECGNINTATQVITVQDTTRPTFTLPIPADTTVNCDAVPTAATLTATDNCSTTPNVSISMNEVRTNGTCANSYRLTRTWTATDECGNIATVSQVITVQDTTKPVFNLPVPADTTVNCDAVPVQPTLTATDNCSATPNVTVTMNETRTSGTCANDYILTRTWTATDECGNATTLTQVVHVQDTTEPVFAIAIPADTTVNCDAVPVQPTLTATDNCSTTPNVTVTSNEVRTNGTCANSYTLTRTWTATDECGNTITATQVIHVQDTTRPAFNMTIPADTTVNCDAIPVQPVLTATDNCSTTANVTVTPNEVRTNGTCANSYTLTRTWTATDECGNQTIATQVITVQDTTKPVFNMAIPADTTVNCDAVPAAATLTATDNCSITANVTVTSSEVRTNGTCANSYTLTRTWTATDECGNQTIATQVITVQDTTKPVFNVIIPADTTVNCDAVPAAATITATDNCSATPNVAVTLNEVRTNGACVNSYILTRTWTATDECGNATTATQVITVQDTTRPVFSMAIPADTTVNCDAVPSAATLTATDNCSATPYVTVAMVETRTNGSCANNYTLTRTWTATDECGNATTATQLITVQDTTKPVFNVPVPADATVDCNAIPTQPDLTATDNCSTASITITKNETRQNIPGACANNYQLIRTWTATDECGNSTTVSQILTVQDTIRPVFNVAIPADTTVSCDAVPAQPSLTATDNCSVTANVTVTMNEVRTNGTCANSYTLTRTWTATDECGNTTTATQVMTVQDTTKPVFTTAAPANVTVACDAIPTAPAITATDNCSPAANVTVTMNEVRTNGSCANSYTLVRTWTATDECGNRSIMSQTITVEDHTAPVFTTAAPANVTVECDAIPAQPNLSATDNCSAPANVTVLKNEVKQPIPGRCVNNYLLIRTWTAIDECNNSTTLTQTITVVDNTAPVFTTAAPANVTVECSNIPSVPTMMATDNCSLNNVNVVYNQVRTNGACTNSYTLTRTWTATDECGNTASVSQVITVEDRTAPVFTATAPASITVQCDAVPAQPDLTATDNCSAAANITIVKNEVRTNGSCPNSYTLTRTWTATDECGNDTTISQVVTVVDNTKPTFTTAPPADVTVECNAIPAAAIMQATDNCSAAANVTITFNEQHITIPGACANNYRLLRTWTATDECGNATTVMQIVTVQDTTAPTFTTAAPADVTVDCDAVPVQPVLTATDNCSVAANVRVTMNETRTNGACANSYLLTRTWTATDECGNARTIRQVITVQDTTKPVFNMPAPANVTVECNAIPAQPNLTATDNCSSTGLTVTRSERMEQIPGATCAGNYRLIRTWTATDECGNSTTVQQIITVEDHTAPTFTMPTPADVTVECNAIPAQPDMTATDNCTPSNNITIVKNERRESIPGAICASNYRLVRSWTATDLCGNSTTVQQVITVQDNTAPTFTMPTPADVTVECDAIPAQPNLTATDNCTPANSIRIVKNETRQNIPGACVNNYRLIRTWTATDECGNTTSVQQVITVSDRTAPTFTTAAPADATVECNAIPVQPNLAAMDNCSGNNVTIVKNERRENIPGACANNYRLVRTWTATDECGNSRTVQQIITVRDTTKPMFTTPVPANVTVECNAIPVQMPLAATDNCSVAANVTVVMSETKETIPGACVNNYRLVRKWTATDECGNSTTVQQIVTVQDKTAPVFNMIPPASITANCDAVPVAPVLTATDNCSGNNVQVAYSFTRQQLSATCVNNYRLNRTWTATDECGNRAIVTQVITVIDTTAPRFNAPAPADMTVSCDAVPAPVIVTASDNCSVANNITITHKQTRENIPGACKGNYRLINTWTAKDECGNTSVLRQVVTVVDTTRPVIVPAPPDITLTCGQAVPTGDIKLRATDNCDGTFPKLISYTTDPFVKDLCNGYTIVRRWKVTDECGNAANDVTQRIIVMPCPKPELEADVVVNCSSDPFITLRTKGVVNRPSYTLVAVTPSNAMRVPTTTSNPRFNVNGATTASFIVRDGITGCASDTVTYTISYLQMPVVNLGNDTSLCGGNGMVLDAGAANFGYQIKWSTGETTQRIRVTQAGTYKVTVSNGICTATDEIKISVIPMPLIDLPDTTICRGQNVILNATVTGGSYLWSTGATTPSINVSTQERFWVRVTKNGCITIDTINVSVNPPPDISLSRDTSICPGQSVQLTVNTNAGRIQWGTGEMGNSITVSKAGNYSVAVYRDNCVVRETVRVAQRPDMKFDLGPDRIICPGGSVLIDARNPDASTYRWSDGDANPVKSFSQSGMYKLGVLDKYCDRYKEDSIKITVAGPPTVTLGNDTTICKGRRFTLRAKAQNATGFLWSNGQTGSSIEVTEAGTYSVTAFNDCGSTTDEITINVTECDSRPDFPNAFSPNGDGNNDVFRPVVRGPMYDYELRIYNRWGELIFISRDQDKGWDGWYKGRPVEIGTYVWWLTYKKVTAGPSFVIKGNITVIR